MRRDRREVALDVMARGTGWLAIGFAAVAAAHFITEYAGQIWTVILLVTL